MNALDATRAWLRAHCPLIDKTDRFNANYLGSHATYKLTFVAQLPYGAALKGNIAAADFFANLANWLRGAERAHNYPQIAGYEVEKIEASNAGILTSADANAARYQIQITIHTKELEA